MKLSTINQGSFKITAEDIPYEKLGSEYLEEVVESNYDHPEEITENVNKLHNSNIYAVLCSDARVMKGGIPMAALAGSRNNIYDEKLDDMIKISIDHHQGDGKGCGARATAEKAAGKSLGIASFDDIVNSIDIHGIDNAINGLGDAKGIALQVNHVDGIMDILKVQDMDLNNGSSIFELYSFINKYEMSFIQKIKTNKLIYNAHNSRKIDHAKEQDPLMLVISLADGVLEDYVSKNAKAKSLGYSFTVKPSVFSRQLGYARIRPMDAGSVLYALNSRHDTLNGHPHGFGSMDTQLVLFQEETSGNGKEYCAATFISRLIEREPLLGERYVDGTINNLVAFGLDNKGQIRDMYKIKVDKN